MNDRDNFKKTIEYTPIRNNNRVIRQEEKILRDRVQIRQRVRKQEIKRRRIRGIATLGALALMGTTLTLVVPEAQRSQNQKMIEQEREIKEELYNRNNTLVIEKEMQHVNTQITERINEIELTKEAILKDVKEQYLEQYNKEYGANIQDCQLLSSNQDYIFMTQEGQYITHGDYPEEVRQFLDNNGISYTVKDTDTKVYYSYVDGKTLEMMTTGKEGNLVDVTSGQKIEKINDKSYKNTLIEMKPVMDKGIEWANDPENKELKEAYIEALENFEEKETQKSANNQDKEEQSQEEEYEL